MDTAQQALCAQGLGYYLPSPESGLGDADVELCVVVLVVKPTVAKARLKSAGHISVMRTR